MSANRPKGIKSGAVTRTYEVATHPNKTASIENSFPIVGSATLIEDMTKGKRNEPVAVTINVTLLLTPALVPVTISFNTPDYNKWTS